MGRFIAYGGFRAEIINCFLGVNRPNFADFGRLGRFWSILDVFGRFWPISVPAAGGQGVKIN
jgi:hypothetical protein